ncbi:hypothetical protein WAI453_007107 [Rhynchosporium graminicola]
MKISILVLTSDHFTVMVAALLASIPAADQTTIARIGAKLLGRRKDGVRLTATLGSTAFAQTWIPPFTGSFGVPNIRRFRLVRMTSTMADNSCRAIHGGGWGGFGKSNVTTRTIKSFYLHQ